MSLIFGAWRLGSSEESREDCALFGRVRRLAIRDRALGQGIATVAARAGRDRGSLLELFHRGWRHGFLQLRAYRQQLYAELDN